MMIIAFGIELMHAHYTLSIRKCFIMASWTNSEFSLNWIVMTMFIKISDDNYTLVTVFSKILLNPAKISKILLNPAKTSNILLSPTKSYYDL